jgi:hypothetical protein
MFEDRALCWAIELPREGDSVRVAARPLPKALGGARASPPRPLALPEEFSGARSTLDAVNRPHSKPAFPNPLVETPAERRAIDRARADAAAEAVLLLPQGVGNADARPAVAPVLRYKSL